MATEIPKFLYKYRGGSDEIFERDLASLVDSYYWSAAIPSLNDPCEALIRTESYFNHLNQFEKIAQSIFTSGLDIKPVKDATSQLFDKVLTTGVFSLSKSYDDELLWSHYAAAHHGFCVGFDMHFLQKGLKPYFSNLIEVRYDPFPPEINLFDQILSREKDQMLLQLIGTKSTKWANEQEIRIVTDEPGRQAYDFRAVSKIYFGLRMPQQQREQVMCALKGRGIDYFEMEMAKDAYRFTPRAVTDLYPSTPRYRYKISPVMDGAIDETSVQPRFKHLTGYLQKAVEVARREPHCVEVIMADFSYSCPDDSPFIFVHCARTDRPFDSNYEYTLSEIDEMFSKMNDFDKA
ncbi:MAG: DUF2971 domain-containing protein [Chryseobacterium sp.]|nr:MAG: DUF2971 domain-containing protein [Chryseobacterium sp.]